MTYPSHSDFVRQRMDDYFAREMTRQYFEDMNKKNRERAREAQSRRTCDPIIFSPNTPTSLALEKRLEEMEKEFYRARAGNSFSFVKLIKSCLTGK